MNYTILICDDDKDILAVLETYLTQEGYQVERAENGLQAVERIQAIRPELTGYSDYEELAVIEQDVASKQDVRVQQPAYPSETAATPIHLVILDIMMPVLDGIQAAVRIRQTSNVPIIFLSAKAEDTDRILGLNMGGDDYITKPFNPLELLARVKAALRRYARLGGMQPGSDQPADHAEQPASANTYQTGDLVLNDDLKRVTLDDQEVTLTALEYNILRLLMTNMERVFTSTQIYETVWDEPAFQVPKTVSVHIRHIREKIEINPKEPQYLKVIYGLGYKVVKLS